MSSAAQVAANHQNSQKSSGPVTEAGKKRAALNSTRHGFTGQVVVLTAEEAEPYRLFNEAFMKDLKPVEAVEQQLSRSIIDGHWRINQLQATESAIYAMGHRQYIEQFAAETPETAAAMARATTFENKKQELDRLHRYESRLQRQVAKDFALFRELQQLRADYNKQQEDSAIRMNRTFRKQGLDWNPVNFGFVWSIAEIEHIERKRTSTLNSTDLLLAQLNG
jgi:hypothetical protein